MTCGDFSVWFMHFSQKKNCVIFCKDDYLIDMKFRQLSLFVFIHILWGERKCIAFNLKLNIGGLDDYFQTNIVRSQVSFILYFQ